MGSSQRVTLGSKRLLFFLASLVLTAITVELYLPATVDAQARRRATPYYADEARDQIEQASKEQSRSVEAISAQVSKSVSDPAIRREIENAMVGLKDGIDQISSVGLRTVEALRDVEKKTDGLLVNNEELKTRLTEIKGQRNIAYAVSAVIAFLALFFRWPFLERKLKKLEITERERNLRERQSPPD